MQGGQFVPVFPGPSWFNSKSPPFQETLDFEETVQSNPKSRLGNWFSFNILWEMQVKIGITYQYNYSQASLVAQMVKNLPIMWETWVWSLGWEDPLEESMATHSSILALRTPWTEEPGELQSMGFQRVGYNWATNTQWHLVNYTLAKKLSLQYNLCFWFSMLKCYKILSAFNKLVSEPPNEERK